MFDRLSEDQRQVLNIVREGHNIFITGQGGTARKNNCLLSSIFSAGEGGFEQMMYRSPERSPQDSKKYASIITRVIVFFPFTTEFRENIFFILRTGTQKSLRLDNKRGLTNNNETIKHFSYLF